MATTKATRDVLDLATRPVINLQCTGGNINGTTIGNTTPAAGYFTNIQADNITLKNNGVLDVSNTGVTIVGTIHAYYAADLAEMYASDEEYPAGTVVDIGGSREITIARFPSKVFGVIASEPAYVLNSTGQEDHLPVTLTGRVPVRVIGPVSKGDRLILSEIPGVAIVGHPDDGVVIGRALVSSAERAERLILAAVRAHI